MLKVEEGIEILIVFQNELTVKICVEIVKFSPLIQSIGTFLTFTILSTFYLDLLQHVYYHPTYKNEFGTSNFPYKTTFPLALKRARKTKKEPFPKNQKKMYKTISMTSL